MYRSSIMTHRSSNWEHRKRFFVYFVPVLLTASLFNLPKFFESQTAIDNNGTLKIDTTDLRENPYYTVYYSSLGRGFVLSFLPSVLLVLLNYKIYRTIKSQPRFGEQESFHAKEFQLRRRKQENNLAVLMIVISLFFIVCHLPRNFLNIYEITVIQRNEKCKAAGNDTFSMWSLVTTQFSNLLVVFNSSTNMILYCIMNKNFRSDFLAIIKCVISIIRCKKPCSCQSNESLDETEIQENYQVVNHNNGVNGIRETAETTV